MRNSLNILLVEGNVGDIEMTERALRDAKRTCHLSVVNNGLAALDFLLKRTDFVNGEDIAQRIGATRQLVQGRRPWLEGFDTCRRYGRRNSDIAGLDFGAKDKGKRHPGLYAFTD